MRHPARTVAGAAAVAMISGLLVALAPGVASAEPSELLFADQIDRYADYDGADGCSAGDKPGAVALMNLVLDAYPGTSGYISRPCAGGSSEHEEGRAFDWMVSADRQIDIAKDLLDWLLADDSYGNENAMVRRLGIMYIIFNHRIWRAYSADQGWQPYDGSNPHTDHVHISMSWDGALKDTTWFTGAELGRRLDQARFAATWRSPGRLDLLRRSSHGKLQIRTWAGTWSDWDKVGGTLDSGPAAVWAHHTLWVFASSKQGTLEQRRWRSSSGWERWKDTGVEISAAPGVASKGRRVDLVVRTPSGSVAHRSWKPRSRWSSWTDLGGVVTSPPAAVWSSSDRLDVFARGTTGHLHQASKVNGDWTGWSDLGGVLTSGPGATSSTPGQTDIFVRTERGSVAYRSDDGSGWSSWAELGGRHVSGPTATAISAARVDLFTRERSGGLLQDYNSGAGWSGWVLR